MLVLALSMLLVAGCGSSSKTSSVAAKASSSTTSTAPASSSSSASPASTSTTSSTATGKRAKRGTASTATTGNGSASGRTPVPNPLRQILRARPHDSFETKLNNLCSRGNRSTLPFARRYRQAFLGHNYVLLASLREQALKAYEAVAHPTSLTPPASHQGAFQRYLAASQSFAKVNHQIDAALAAHNLSGVQKLQQTIVAVGTARAQAAIALGARSCAI